MRNLLDKLFGDPERVGFEERIFNVVALFGVFMAIFGTAMDVYYGISLVPGLIIIGCLMLAYYFSRFRGGFPIASVASAGFIIFVFFPYTWIANGGCSSVLPYYIIAIAALLCIFLRGRVRLMMLLSMFAIELILVTREAVAARSLWVIIPGNTNYFEFLLHYNAILLIVTAVIVIYSRIYRKEQEKSETYAQSIQEQARQQLYYMKSLEQLNRKLRSERHDFNNHLGVIYGLLESGEAGRAGEYARRLVKNTEEYRSLITIPYSTLRAMLNYKLSAAQENGIVLRLSAVLPEGLPIDEFDTATILGNLLDNAVEACGKLNGSDRYIALTLMYQPDYLIIRVENPVEPGSFQRETSGLLSTTKTDKNSHGFGLKNIDYLVKKHDGLLKIEPSDGVFRVHAALMIRPCPDCPDTKL